MFNRRGPWLGQVPLILGPSSWRGVTPSHPPMPTGPSYDVWWVHFGRDAGLPYNPPAREHATSLPEGGEIQATGGRIVKRIGFLWFFPDDETRAKIEAATGQPVSESIEVQVTHCNPTPGTFPALGDFTDPDTGLVCFLDLPQGWSGAWSGWDELKAKLGQESDPFTGAVEWEEGVGYVPYDPIGTPPYWGEWGALGECGKVGPFDTIDEAFSAAADAAVAHGSTALPGDGWAQVKDSRGKGKGPIT